LVAEAEPDLLSDLSLTKAVNEPGEREGARNGEPLRIRDRGSIKQEMD
jgi:hypothetical protein